MKKLFYGFTLFFITLVLAIVFAANSSFVIKKAADKFAPEYKISYDDITGNILTGVTIDGLKFEGKTITKSLRFSWNPSRLIHKRIAVNEINIDALDVDVVKSLIASFTSDDNSTSAPFPLVVNVGKVHLSVNPFEEQGIFIEKIVLDVEDVTYANDEIGIDHVMAKVDTNITNVLLEASLEDGELQIEQFLLKNIDTLSLEKLLAKEQNATSSDTSKTAKSEQKEPLNPLIPTEVKLNKFVVSIKPRDYKSAKIDKVEVKLNELYVDIPKIISNSKNSLSIGNISFVFDSNVTHIDITGDMKQELVTLENINLEKVDTLALQALFASDSNTSDNNATETVVENNNTKEEKKEPNNLIPQFVVIKELHTDLLPATYDPVHIFKLVLDGKDIKFNVTKLLVENGDIDLNGTTNLTNFKHNGKIKNNQLLGDIVLTPNKELFELYKLPIRKEAIGDIKINFNASKERVVADIKAKAKQILLTTKTDNNQSTDADKSAEFNLDIDSLLSHVVYTIKNNSLAADSKIMLTTPYAKDISISNKFEMDDNISYTGEINAKELIGIDVKFTKPLQDLNIKYSGDIKSIHTLISSDGLKGSFDSSDFKKGKIHLETVKTILVNEMVALPAELNGTKVNAVVDMPLDFAAITPLKAKVKITSNITNLDADIIYEKTLKVDATSNMPQDSLLKAFDKNIKWNAINPLVINAELDDRNVTLKLKAEELSANIKYFFDEGKVDGEIKLGGLITDVKGIAQKKITINSKVDSMKSLLGSVQSFYTLEDLPPLEGALNLSMDVIEMKQAHLSLASPKIIYKPDHKTEYVINDVKVITSFDKSKVLLKEYIVTYDKMKFFSTKPSTISFKDEIISIEPLWLNDELKVVGEYNTKTERGKVDTQANKLHIAHEIIDLDSNIDIKTLLDGNKTSVNGKVILLGGDIHYDMGQKTFASDSDIVIVQDMKEEKESPFMDNLSTEILIKTKKPLIYKKGAINIKAKVDLGVHKAEHAELMVLGSVEILEGGSYIFEGKKFVLDKSFVHFTGNPNKPLLEVSVKYKSLNHLITITVSGTPNTPNINFSSKPSLSKEQILSIILFDSEEGAGTNSGEDMMKMMGGAMAKSALSDMGIKLDHLVLGEGSSVEVGKKLTDKITIIYVNDEVPIVKIKYLHGKHTESVIGASEESQSYDIIYKRDF